MKDQTFPLILIAECAKRIEEYTRSGQEAFEQSPLIQDAVVWNLEIIGEATSLVQDYRAVDLKAVWQITQEELPPVGQQVSAIMSQG